jgi:predicted phosphodiesterase
MRIAIVSDIHGNRTAFEAVLADLREVSPGFAILAGQACWAIRMKCFSIPRR